MVRRLAALSFVIAICGAASAFADQPLGPVSPNAEMNARAFQSRCGFDEALDGADGHSSYEINLRGLRFRSRIIFRRDTEGMKTAVSFPDEVFDGAERLAKRTKKSRSRLFSDAVREYRARTLRSK